jgi:hypothetical protein
MEGTMYNDSSRNFMTAMQGVDMLLDPLLRGLSNFRPVGRYQYQTGVSLGAYQRLVQRYNELAEVSQRAVIALRSRAVQLEAENARLREELARSKRR